MLKKRFGISLKAELANIVLISNTLIWYSIAFNVLKTIINETSTLMWTAHFMTATFLAIVGSIITDKSSKRTTFLMVWMTFGIVSSLFLILVDPSNTLDVLAISFLFGMSFGLGLPASMAYFVDYTIIENRGKLGGLILCINGLGTVLFWIMAVNNIILQALTLAIWRGCGLIIFAIIKPSKELEGKRKSISFASILNQRSFILYIIPWIMFSLIAYLSLPVQLKILDIEIVKFFSIIESIAAGAFAIVGGFLSDTIGRKRITITGFIMLGLAYALLGVYPGNLLSWYFYTLVDGIAWGIFYVIFIITIWGDLSHGASSDKYYALGGLPYFVSNFLRLTIGSHIAETVSAYAIFSFTAFFLFLAVLPLMFAPETLPEKKLRERELREYIEKAKKIKEKFT